MSKGIRTNDEKTNVGVSRYYLDGVVICRTLDRQNSGRQNHI